MSDLDLDLRVHAARLPERAELPWRGRVVELTGLAVRATLEGVRQGELCHIARRAAPPLAAEVVGFRGGEAVLLPLGETRGLALGAEVSPTGRPLTVGAGHALLGRVLDGLGQPIDG
ncbi:MAG TPA: EscN/YscN/HrcN family type III secretion system ATPase, partial [Anaeromyxobacteraceae bacterium]